MWISFAYIGFSNISNNETTHKNLHYYIDVSIRKESTANVNGDGPLQNNNLLVERELKALI